MSDLTDFLLARIAEDEHLYRGAMHMGCVEDRDDSATVIHSATCPNRVLAECDAKRRIVDWHRLVDGLDDEDKPVRGCSNCIASGAVPPYLIEGPCLTVRLLALPYADHPDYRSEWAP